MVVSEYYRRRTKWQRRCPAANSVLWVWDSSFGYPAGSSSEKKSTNVSAESKLPGGNSGGASLRVLLHLRMKTRAFSLQLRINGMIFEKGRIPRTLRYVRRAWNSCTIPPLVIYVKAGKLPAWSDRGRTRLPRNKFFYDNLASNTS